MNDIKIVKEIENDHCVVATTDSCILQIDLHGLFRIPTTFKFGSLNVSVENFENQLKAKIRATIKETIESIDGVIKHEFNTDDLIVRLEGIFK